MKRLLFFGVVLTFFVSQASGQNITTSKLILIPPTQSVFNITPVSAVNTKTGRTLIVWERINGNDHSIWGKLINVNGKSASGQFQIIAGPVASHPTVAYNPIRNEFLLAYDNNPNVQIGRSDIFVQRLNFSGRPISGTNQKISTDTLSSQMGNFFPKILWNSRNATFSIVWLREIGNPSQVNEGNNGLVGTVLNSFGAVSGSPVLLQKTVLEGNRLWGPIPLDVAFHPNGKFMLAWVQTLVGTDGKKIDYFLSRLEANFTNQTVTRISLTPIDVTGGFSWAARFAFPTPGGFIFYVDANNMKRRKIDATGKIVGGAALAFRPPKNTTKLLYPALSYTTGPLGAKGLLIAVQDAFSESGQASIWAQVLDASGVGKGPARRIDVTSTGESAFTLAMNPLPFHPKLDPYRFALYYVLAKFTTPGQTFQNSGIVLLNLNVTFP